MVAEQGYAAAQVAVGGVGRGRGHRVGVPALPSKASLFTEMLRVVCDRELTVVQAIAAERERPALDRISDAVATFADRALRGDGLAYAVTGSRWTPGWIRSGWPPAPGWPTCSPG